MISSGGVLASAAEVEQFCQNQNLRFCFIGGLAVQRWGSPRFTQDVDSTILASFGEEAAIVDPILQRFPGRRSDAREFALAHRVILARTSSGVDLDFSLGGLAFEEGSIQRASIWQATQTIHLTTCLAEDLVIHKAFAGRARDWSDVESVLVRQHGKLDLAHIRAELPPLLELKEEIESLTKLEQMIAAVAFRMR